MPAVEASPTPEDIGRATWTLLHSMAAAYPERPSPQVQEHTRSWLESLAVVYPCKWCRDDWGQLVAQSPPAVASRSSLEQWMCQQHNKVNVKLGKEEFDCANAHKRWAVHH
jgi:FAD-linked sulfhydryl oxidase